MKFLLGLIVGLLIIPVAGFIYYHVGHPPVAVADQPFLLERELVPVATRARPEHAASRKWCLPERDVS